VPHGLYSHIVSRDSSLSAHTNPHTGLAPDETCHKAMTLKAHPFNRTRWREHIRIRVSQSQHFMKMRTIPYKKSASCPDFAREPGKKPFLPLEHTHREFLGRAAFSILCMKRLPREHRGHHENTSVESRHFLDATRRFQAAHSAFVRFPPHIHLPTDNCRAFVFQPHITHV